MNINKNMTAGTNYLLVTSRVIFSYSTLKEAEEASKDYNIFAIYKLTKELIRSSYNEAGTT